MITSYPDRRFQLWEYRVSHGSLLVRSPRNPDSDKNIDIIFVGVEFISSPRHLKGVELYQDVHEDVERATAEFGVTDPGHIFVLLSGGRRHLVVAAAVRVEENWGDIFDSPFA